MLFVPTILETLLVRVLLDTPETDSNVLVKFTGFIISKHVECQVFLNRHFEKKKKRQVKRVLGLCERNMR